LLRRDVRDWDTRNLRIETQVTEVQRASIGYVKAVGLTLSTKSWYAWWLTSITSQKGERSIGTVSSGVVQESHTVSTCEVPERRARTPSITSQKEDRSIGTVSSGDAQESPTISTCEVPERRA